MHAMKLNVANVQTVSPMTMYDNYVTISYAIHMYVVLLFKLQITLFSHSKFHIPFHWKFV